MQDEYLYLLEHLKDELELVSIGAVLTEQEEINILRAEITGLGRAGNSVLLEAMMIPFEVEEGQRLFQIYTTIAADIDEDNLIPAIIEVNKMNVSMPLGTLGIFADVRQMYHKYTMLVEDSWSEDTITELCTASLFNILNILDLIYDEAIIISNNVADLKRYYELIEKESTKKAEVAQMLGFDDSYNTATINSAVEYALSSIDDDDEDEDED